MHYRAAFCQCNAASGSGSLLAWRFGPVALSVRKGFAAMRVYLNELTSFAHEKLPARHCIRHGPQHACAFARAGARPHVQVTQANKTETIGISAAASLKRFDLDFPGGNPRDRQLLGAFSHEHAAIIAAGTKEARLVIF